MSSISSIPAHEKLRVDQQKFISVLIPMETYEDLRRLSFELRIPQRSITAEGIARYIRTLKSKQQKQQETA